MIDHPLVTITDIRSPRHPAVPRIRTGSAVPGLLLCLVILVALSGCGSGKESNAAVPKQEPTPSESTMPSAASETTSDASGEKAGQKLPADAASVTSAVAAEMRLVRMVGAVSLRNGDGNPVNKHENMRLASGDELSTAIRSRAGVSLDDTKAVTVGEQSRAILRQEDRLLGLRLESGEMYFSVSEPLKEDETFEIETSTIVMGIRGTSGYVSALTENSSAVILTSGQVELRAMTGETQHLKAGQRVIIEAKDEKTRFHLDPVTPEDYPTLLLEELAADEGMLAEVSAQTVAENLEYVPAMEAYRQIILHAEDYEFLFPNYGSVTDSPNTLTGVYRYAFEKVRPDDPVPALLISAESTFGIDSIRVFYYEPSSGSILAPDELLEEGVGSAGGFRGSIAMMADGNGFRETGISSGTGEGEISRVELRGDRLVRDHLWSGNMFTETVPEIAYRDIVWQDRSHLEDLKGSLAAALPTDGDRTVLRGTVRIASYQEMLEIQGVPDPNPGTDTSMTGPITVIILDEPRQISAMTVDDLYTPSLGTASMIKIFGGSLEQDDGREVIFSIDPHTTYWPSDTSLPLGQPATRDIHILN